MENAGKNTKGSGWVSVLVDYGPLAVFLTVYKLSAAEKTDTITELGAVINGTLAFMIAAVIALVASRFILGKVSPMLWFSTALIVGFGTLTVLFHDPTFVQIKPTIIYACFGLSLLIAWWWKGKALLRYLLEAAFVGLNDDGWLKLSRNWGIFFLFLALLNEGIRHYYNVANGNFETWLWAKFWVFMPLTFGFTVTQIPMLMRHGFGLEEDDDDLDSEYKI